MLPTPLGSPGPQGKSDTAAVNVARVRNIQASHTILTQMADASAKLAQDIRCQLMDLTEAQTFSQLTATQQGTPQDAAASAAALLGSQPSQQLPMDGMAATLQASFQTLAAAAAVAGHQDSPLPNVRPGVQLPAGGALLCPDGPTPPPASNSNDQAPIIQSVEVGERLNGGCDTLATPKSASRGPTPAADGRQAPSVSPYICVTQVRPAFWADGFGMSQVAA